MSKAVICGYVRSPFTLANKGELKRVRPDDMGAQVVRALVEKSGVNADDVEDLKMGCAFPEGEQGLNLARNVGFLAKLPITVAGVTMNRFCGSSMQTIHDAAGAICSEAGDVFVCAGVESMSRIPMGGYNPLPHPGLYEDYPEAYISMGETAENLAKRNNIDRKAQEEFALASHQKAANAQSEGRFDEEIVAIRNNGETIEKDGCIRADSSLEKMAELDPAFDQEGSVTAATSSPLTDGAAAVLVCSENYADTHHLPKIARIRAMSVVGVAPEIMGIGPVSATAKVLERAGLGLDDMDVIELNEAFAAQSLAVLQELGIKPDDKRLNIDGGAIALGHPLGTSGARITGKAAQLLKRQEGKYALATMCIGGGQGIATVLEAC